MKCVISVGCVRWLCQINHRGTQCGPKSPGGSMSERDSGTQAMSRMRNGLIEPHMPAAKPLGRPRDTELRDVVDAILYIARTGCQWRMLPKDFPPFTTVQGYFYDWRDNGLFEKINFELLLQAREAAGKRAHL